MGRYKGRASAKTIAHAFPHMVEIVVPAGGLGRRLDAMHAFHAERGIPSRQGPRRRESERDVIAWCFADPATADAFAAEFGGRRITSRSPPAP